MTRKTRKYNFTNEAAADAAIAALPHDEEGNPTCVDSYEGFCYRWYDSSNGMYYVGSHKGTVDDGYIGSGKWFKDSYKKRKNKFQREILYTGDYYRLYEQILLDYEDAANSKYFYNLKNAAEGGYTRNGRPMSKEARENMSKAKRGRKHPMYGKKITETHRLKLSKARKGGNNPSAVRVYSEYLDKEFSTLLEFAKEMKLSKSYCSRMLNGVKKNLYGLKRI